MDLHICTGGGNNAIDELFWDGVDGMGIEAGQCVQVNTPFGRDRSNLRNYPEHFLDDEIREVFYEMGEHTYHRLGRAYLHPGAPLTLGFWDYEPRLYGTDGSIVGRWMLDKLRNGYNKKDAVFLRALTDGMRQGFAKAGFLEAGLSGYATPRITKGPALPRDYEHAKQSNAFANGFDWGWVNAYHRGDLDHDHLDHDNIVAHFARLTDAKRLVTEAIMPHKDEDARKKRVMGAITVLGRGLNRADLLQYNAVTIEVMYQLGYTDLVIWVDCQHESVARRQLDSLTDLLPMIDRVSSLRGEVKKAKTAIGAQ